MAKHRDTSDDDTIGIPKILSRMVKLSNDNANRVKVQPCRRNCGNNANCPECAGTGTATDWSS